MAEAIVNHQLAEVWRAYSAGTEPAGYVHPKAIQTFTEIGIKHEGVSKHPEVFLENPMDLVVTVCDDAAENCPVWLGKGQRVHLDFPDPAAATGIEEEIMTVFRQVRDDIGRQVLKLLNDQ